MSAGSAEVGDFSVSWLVIFFGLVLFSKLQMELSRIHHSRNVPYLKSQSIKSLACANLTD